MDSSHLGCIASLWMWTSTGADYDPEFVFRNQWPRKHGKSQPLFSGLRYIANGFGVDSYLSLKPKSRSIACTVWRGSHDGRENAVMCSFTWLNHLSAERVECQCVGGQSGQPSIHLAVSTNAVTTAINMTNTVGVDATGTGLTVSGTGGSIIVPAISSVTCNPVNLNTNAASSCTVTLSSAAPTGGSNVTLASNNASLTVPASVTVAAGATTATFSATAAASLASNQSATVTATLGSSSQTATISLLAPVLVSGMACAPTTLLQSAVSTCTVTLTQTAPTGGSNVTLASNNASLTVPASATVAAGATTASFIATAVFSAREQSERDRHRHSGQQFPNRYDQSAGSGPGFGRGL